MSFRTLDLNLWDEINSPIKPSPYDSKDLKLALLVGEF